MNIYIEWTDFFGEDRAVPLCLSGEDPTFSDLFRHIKHEAGVDPQLFQIIFSGFDITSIDNFSTDKPLSWIGISNHATIKLQSKNPIERSDNIEIPDTDMQHKPPRFDVDDPSAYEYLKENGYVVIKEVLTAQERTIAEEMCWKWIESLTDGEVRRSDVATWGSKAWPADRDTGIITDPSAGQSDWLWFVRSKPKIKQAFAHIWETNLLGVSFDSGNFFRPYAVEPEWRTKGGWFHVDQNARLLPGKCCVQGMVSLNPATEKTGGLTVIPKSHLRHGEFCERNDAGGHFLPINERDPIRQMPSVLVSCGAGDLVLWDSRTVHCNTPGLGSLIENDLIRMNAYVCMQPISMCAEEAKAKRLSAFDRHITTSHWVSIYSEHKAAENFVPHEFELSKEQRNLVWPESETEEPVEDGWCNIQ